METTRSTQILKPRLDKDLPIIRKATLPDIIGLYLELAKPKRFRFGRHSSFALTGHSADERGAFRVMLFDGRELVDPETVKQTLDIDSGIGFVFPGDQFPIQPGYSLFINVLNNTNFTLKSSLHLPPFNIPDAGGNPTPDFTEPHQIPHIYLGFMGGASVPQIPVRMGFPHLQRLREACDGNGVSKERVEILYNKGIYLAMRKTLPAKNFPFWPPSFSSEVFRAGNENGTVTFSQRQIPEEYIDAFFEALHQIIDNTPELNWARGFFLQIQVQGTKEATAHTVEVLQESQQNQEVHPTDPESEHAFRRERTRQIVRALWPIDLRKVKGENWTIDIATTIYLDNEDHSLLIRKETHARFISLLTGVSIAKAQELIDGEPRSGYHFDEFFHTGLFGGFRFTIPSDLLTLWKVLYIQAYTTEKTLTAHKENGKYAKELDPCKVFRQMKNTEKTFLDPVLKLTKEAIEEKRQIHIRVESRVRLPFAWDVHRKYDVGVLCLLTSKLPTTYIWGWRVIRLESIRETFRAYRQNINSVPRTLLPPPASLIIGLTWMANAMINRPKAGGEWGVLRDTLCVHAMVNGKLAPVRPLAIFFLHSLSQDPCPRLSTHRYLSLKSILTLLGLPRGAADTELVKLFSGNNHRKSLARVDNNQTANNDNPAEAERSFTRVVVSRAARMTTHIPANAPRVFTEEEAAQIPEVVVEHQYASEEEDPQQQHDTFSNLRSLNSIFQRMASEILRKVPSTKTDHRSWRKISDAEAYRVQWDALCDSMRIKDLLVGWVQVVDEDKWIMVVNRLFPDLETYREKTRGGKKYMQNVAQCSWFQDYADILDDSATGENEKREITEQARRKLREEAEWLPLGQADRMWGSGYNDAVLHGIRIGPHLPAIVLNPNPRGKERPSADIPGGRLIMHDV